MKREKLSDRLRKSRIDRHFRRSTLLPKKGRKLIDMRNRERRNIKGNRSLAMKVRKVNLGSSGDLFQIGAKITPHNQAPLWKNRENFWIEHSFISFYFRIFFNNREYSTIDKKSLGFRSIREDDAIDLRIEVFHLDDGIFIGMRDRHEAPLFLIGTAFIEVVFMGISGRDEGFDERFHREDVSTRKLYGGMFLKVGFRTLEFEKVWGDDVEVSFLFERPDLLETIYMDDALFELSWTKGFQ